MTRKEDWLPIFRSSNRVELLTIQNMLEEAGIEVTLLEQQDRMYPMIGDNVLLVPQKYEVQARELVIKFEENEQLDETDA